MALKNGYPFYFSVVVCLCTSPLEIVVSIVSGSTEDFEKGTCFFAGGGRSHSTAHALFSGQILRTWRAA